MVHLVIPLLLSPADLPHLISGTIVHESLLAYLPPATASCAVHVRGGFYQI